MRLKWEGNYPSNKPGQHWRFFARDFACADAILIITISWFSGSPNLSPNPMSPAHNNLGKHVILRAECNYSQDSDILELMLFLEVVRFWWGCEYHWCSFLLILFAMIRVVHSNSIWNKEIWTYLRVKLKTKKCWQTNNGKNEWRTAENTPMFDYMSLKGKYMSDLLVVLCYYIFKEYRLRLYFVSWKVSL